MNSLMEKRMEKLGIYSLKPLPRTKGTKEADFAEIAYLRVIENQGYRRMATLSRIYQSTAERVSAARKQRLEIEALYAPVEICKPFKRNPTQKTSPKSREEILKSWEGLPQAEIDRLIAMLEELKK